MPADPRSSDTSDRWKTQRRINGRFSPGLSLPKADDRVPPAPVMSRAEQEREFCRRLAVGMKIDQDLFLAEMTKRNLIMAAGLNAKLVESGLMWAISLTAFALSGASLVFQFIEHPWP